VSTCSIIRRELIAGHASRRPAPLLLDGQSHGRCGRDGPADCRCDQVDRRLARVGGHCLVRGSCHASSRARGTTEA
jgi:hypothetical protein